MAWSPWKIKIICIRDVFTPGNGDVKYPVSIFHKFCMSESLEEAHCGSRYLCVPCVVAQLEQ